MVGIPITLLVVHGAEFVHQSAGEIVSVVASGRGVCRLRAGVR